MKARTVSDRKIDKRTYNPIFMAARRAMSLDAWRIETNRQKLDLRFSYELDNNWKKPLL